MFHSNHGENEETAGILVKSGCDYFHHKKNEVLYWENVFETLCLKKSIFLNTDNLDTQED